MIETGQIAAPDELANRLAITDILHGHCRGLDRSDADSLKAVYWPEAEVDYGAFKGSAHQFADLVVVALAEPYELTQHTIGNTIIQFDGDHQANTESYVTARHLLADGSAEMVFSGRYLDRLERRGDCWKLIHRQVVMDWSRMHSVVDEREGEAFAALSKGDHGPKDPSFQHFVSGE
ncbi:nuclear transport factor 2 family protein [Oceanicoccus sagamiensis]|uniref:SnoaL-like domain-containing protein n=1 Tax=Oceanicoccus sagamiensis TaxID=716816 RepID=A0A1X9NGY0_9GAMM|nr:nuclear transport factor 2 family protein [Oceanicoccus sagamiensis]ARN73263.1 hypothetical protein BST96_03555 [Oceanicoccus sagamiensis]